MPDFSFAALGPLRQTRAVYSYGRFPLLNDSHGLVGIRAPFWQEPQKTISYAGEGQLKGVRGKRDALRRKFVVAAQGVDDYFRLCCVRT